MAERVRLRLQNAEEVIAQAKEHAAAREQQMQRLKEKGQMIPPEASIIGCWQMIEQTVICNLDPHVVENKLGNYRTFFQLLSPDGHLFGQSVTSGSIVLSGHHAGKPWPGIGTYEVTGKITGEGMVKYRELPREGKDYIDIVEGYGLRRLPVLTVAHWQGWEMEGKYFNDTSGIESEFKSIRTKGQVWI